MSHKSAKETISCQESSNVVIGVYVLEAIKYWITAKRLFLLLYSWRSRQGSLDKVGATRWKRKGNRDD